MAELGLLRSMKGAVDEGLITESDYDSIKAAFVKAMQIKAGVDAGFIQKEDYDRTKDAFLHSLDFTGVAPAPAIAPVAAPRATLPSNGSSSALNTAAQFARPAPAPVRTFARVPDPTGSASGNTSPAPRRPDPPKSSTGVTAGKTSLAGISVNEECVTLYANVKTRSTYKWVMFKINDSGQEVIVDQLGSHDSTFSDFVSALPDSACRYAVYDFQYVKQENGAVIQKLVFIHWAPDNSGTKSKIMYSTTKDFFKGFLDGLGAEFQASDASEISEEDIQERIMANMTRK